MIDWKVTKEEADIIHLIGVRAVNKFRFNDLLKVEMDITACHNSGNPLRLQELLDADDYEFKHDVDGIVKNINRRTGKLENFFVPRFSK